MYRGGANSGIHGGAKSLHHPIPPMTRRPLHFCAYSSRASDSVGPRRHGSRGTRT
jgi:hypothetical protein